MVTTLQVEMAVTNWLCRCKEAKLSDFEPVYIGVDLGDKKSPELHIELTFNPKPVKKILTKIDVDISDSQKYFQKYQFVKIDEAKSVSTMGDVPEELNAIIESRFDDLDFDVDVDENYDFSDFYSLYLISKEKISRISAFFHKSQLSLSPDQDKEKAKEMIQDYFSGN